MPSTTIAAQAARILGISERNLYRKLRDYGWLNVTRGSGIGVGCIRGLARSMFRFDTALVHRWRAAALEVDMAARTRPARYTRARRYCSSRSRISRLVRRRCLRCRARASFQSALADGLHDRAVFLVRWLEIRAQPDRGDPGAVALVPEDVGERLEARVAARFEQRPVEPLVGGDPAVAVVLAYGRIHRVERSVDGGEDGRVDLGARQALDRGQLERREHLVHVAQVSDR